MPWWGWLILWTGVALVVCVVVGAALSQAEWRDTRRRREEHDEDDGADP